jgi:archaellin
MLYKKGDIGIGALIIIIAILLVVGIAAVVLIQTNQSLGEKIHRDAMDTKSVVSTHATALKLVAIGNSSGGIDTFEYQVRLTSGSEPIILRDSILHFQTDRNSFSLNFAGNSTIQCIKSNSGGYNTYGDEELGLLSVFKGNLFRSGQSSVLRTNSDYPLNTDLDNDGVNDSLRACGSAVDNPCPAPYNGTHIRATLSGGGYAYANLSNNDGTQAYLIEGGEFNITYSPLKMVDGTVLGFISGARTDAGAADQIQSPASSGGDTIAFDVYKELTILDDDLDSDGIDDRIGINHTNVLIFLSSINEEVYYWANGYIPTDNAISIPLGITLDTTPQAISVNSEIVYEGTSYGSIVINGNSGTTFNIPAAVTFTVSPSSNGGKFCVTYNQKDKDFREFLLQNGDLITLRFETNEGIGESLGGKVTFIPRHGAPTVTEFKTPDVINTQNILLYP